MPIKEDEELFLVLNLLREPNPQYLDQLKESGYLDENQTNTAKAEEFISTFIRSKQDQVYAAILEKGSYFKDKGYVLLKAEIKDPLCAELILEDLVRQGKLKKKAGHGYIIRCGYNHATK